MSFSRVVPTISGSAARTVSNFCNRRFINSWSCELFPSCSSAWLKSLREFWSTVRYSCSDSRRVLNESSSVSMRRIHVEISDWDRWMLLWRSARLVHSLRHFCRQFSIMECTDLSKIIYIDKYILVSYHSPCCCWWCSSLTSKREDDDCLMLWTLMMADVATCERGWQTCAFHGRFALITWRWSDLFAAVWWSIHQNMFWH